MKRQKKVAPPAPVRETVFAERRPSPWETFFRCQRSPMLRSQLLTSLSTGRVIDIERLPAAALLDMVLIATASRVFCEAEVVSDYTGLLRRTREEWQRPEWTCRVFDSVHMSTADFIIIRDGVSDFPGADVAYIPDMVEWYLNHDVPEYFAKELTQ